jgi:hypothetical protein
VKKSCIHIAHPDGKRLIPFDTFNMFYRGELEGTRLAGLREMEMAGAGNRLGLPEGVRSGRGDASPPE